MILKRIEDQSSQLSFFPTWEHCKSRDYVVNDRRPSETVPKLTFLNSADYADHIIVWRVLYMGRPSIALVISTDRTILLLKPSKMGNVMHRGCVLFSAVFEHVGWDYGQHLLTCIQEAYLERSITWIRRRSILCFPLTEGAATNLGLIKVIVRINANKAKFFFPYIEDADK